MTSANKDYPGDPVWIEKLRKMHPFRLAMYVALVGICIMFGFLIFGFIVTKNDIKLGTNIWFLVSTIIIILSWFIASKFKQYYSLDDISKLYKSYLAELFLGFLFGLTQFLGWYLMQKQGITFAKGNISHTYLYLLSFLHLVHYFGGIIYIVYLIAKTYKVKNNVVKHLVFSTDPYEIMLIELATLYLHFMTYLWVIIFIVFNII